MEVWKSSHHFADDIIKCIFLIENVCILIQISIKFVLQGLIVNKLALIQAMTWQQASGKPLPESVVIHFIDAYMHHLTGIC